jgi:ABC-type uncharacterized transport system permease subunit
MFSKTDIEKYFASEKQLGLVFLVFAVLALGSALFFVLNQKTPFHRGASLPVFLFAGFLLYAGYGLYSKSDDRRIRDVYAYDMDPGHLSDKELPRLQSMRTDVGRLHMAGFVLLGLSVAASIYLARKTDLAFWYGFAFSTALVALTLCGLTYLMASRLSEFTSRMQSFLHQGG